MRKSQPYHDFFGFKIIIDPLVYRPSEDTHLLIEQILAHDRVEFAAELGSGSGVVSLITSTIATMVLAYETSVYAYKNVLKNIRLNSLEKKIEVFLDEGLNGPQVDLVIINPPYLPQEPFFIQDSLSTAWNGGTDGLRVALRMIRIAAERMKESGSMLIVYSSLQKEARFIKALKRQGFEYSVIGSKKVFYEELKIYECHKNAS